MFDRVQNALLLTLLAPTPQNGQTYSNNRRLLPMNCLSVFDHFVGLAHKGLNYFRNVL